MALTEPAGLPAWETSQTRTPRSQYANTPFVTGPGRRRRVFTTAPDVLTLSRVMTAAEAATWWAWYMQTGATAMRGGVMAFEAVVATLGSGTETVALLMLGQPTLTPRPGGVWTLQAQAITDVTAGGVGGGLGEGGGGGTTFPTVSVNDITANEDAGVAVFTITASAASTAPMFIGYTTVSGAATAADYTPTEGIATIAAGETSTTVLVPLAIDGVTEGAEVFYLQLTGATRCTIADGTGACTLSDASSGGGGSPSGFYLYSPFNTPNTNGTIASVVTESPLTAGQTVEITTAGDYVDPAWTCTLSSTPELLEGLNIVLDVSRPLTLSPSWVLEFKVSGSQPLGIYFYRNSAPADDIRVYHTANDTTALFAQGTGGPASSARQVIRVEARDGFLGIYISGTLVASSEASSALNTNPVPVLLAFGAGVELEYVKIISNDVPFPVAPMTVHSLAVTDSAGVAAVPRVSVGDITVAETAGAAVFTLSLDVPSDDAVSVGYITQNGTALAGQDYTASSGAATIAAGTTSTTVSVPVTADALTEGAETFQLLLSGPSGCVIADGSATCTISANVAVPTASINSISVSETAGTATFTVTLSGAYTSDVTLDYATANGSATAGSDYTAKSGTLTILAGETSGTIGVAIVTDATTEPNQTFTVTLSSPVNATLATAVGTCTILANSGPITVSIASAATVAEASGIASLAVSLSEASASTVTVNYATADGTATAGADYTTASGTLTFTPGQVIKSISVSLINDADFESNETFTVTLSSPSGATLGNAIATVTITSEDAAGIPNRFWRVLVHAAVQTVDFNGWQLRELELLSGTTDLTTGLGADTFGTTPWNGAASQAVDDSLIGSVFWYPFVAESWWGIDLGTSEQPDALTIRGGETDTAGNLTDFSVQWSDNGTSGWTTVQTFTGVTWNLDEAKRFNLLTGDVSTIGEGSTGVALLLHGDGTAGSATVTDSSVNALTPATVTDVTVTTSPAGFGSGVLTSSSTSATVAWAESVEFSTPAEFTLECRLYVPTLPAGVGYAVGIGGVAFVIDGANALGAGAGCIVAGLTEVGVYVPSAAALATGAWVHLAITRDAGGTVRFFLNGALQGTNTNTDQTTTAAPAILFGYAGSRIDSVIGSIEELRWTRGSAVYTANFTPPTGPLS